MTDQEKNEIMASSIFTGVQKHKATSMTQLAVSMGLLKKGQSVSGSFSKKVKSLVPDIDNLFIINREKIKAEAGNGGSEGKGANQVSAANEAKGTKVAKEPKVAKVVAEPKSSPQKTPKTPKPLKTLKTAKTVKAPKSKVSSPGSSSLYPRHEKNPFRLNSSYSKVFDCFASFKNGVRRDELLTKVSEAVGKDLMHSKYDLAVIISAKDSNTGPRHRSCPEGFWVRRENDNLTLEID